MTSLAAWPGIDSRGLSTLYIVADSRISWPGSGDSWNFGSKVFASTLTPDIFGFYGDVLIPSMVLPRLVEGTFLDPVMSTQERHETSVQLLRQSADAVPMPRRGRFGVLHGSRDGDGMNSRRLLWHTQWSAKQGWSDDPVVLEDASALTIALGSGDLAVINHQAAAVNELGSFSRTVFTGFCDALGSRQDPNSGGAPQLVGLYRHGTGLHFGVFHRGKAYYRGLEVGNLTSPAIEWRNALFERCDSEGKLLAGAQAQPRLKS